MLEGDAYLKFDGKELVLRDYLAVARTILANERTMLSYIRTAFTSLILGISMIKFLGSSQLNYLVGWMFIVFAAIVVVYGVIRFYKMRNLILTEEKSRDFKS